MRQLRDMKTSVPPEALCGQVLLNFADMCGWALARAHAKAGHAARLCGYLGSSDQFDRAVANFAFAYADQCQRDYEDFVRSQAPGAIPVRA